MNPEATLFIHQREEGRDGRRQEEEGGEQGTRGDMSVTEEGMVLRKQATADLFLVLSQLKALTGVLLMESRCCSCHSLTSLVSPTGRFTPKLS